MSSKLSQILVLLTAITATLQRKLVSDNDGNSLNKDGLQNLVDHLKTHAYPSQDAKPYLGKQRSGLGSLLNIHTLNLYVKGDEEKQSQRSGVEEDRMCSKEPKRCGCGHGRAGCNKDEDREDSSEVQDILDELESVWDSQSLRCYKECGSSERCGCSRSRPDDRDENEQREYNLKSNLEKLGRKYKINDNLDAFVVDISNFKGLFGKANGYSKNRQQSQTREVDLDYLGEVRNSDDRDNNGGLDSVVLNLGSVKDEEDLVSQVVNDLLYKTKQKTEDDDPIRPNELADYFEGKKQKVVRNALNFVRNSRGNKDLSLLSSEQQYQLQKVRSEVQKLGSRADLKEVEQKVTDIIVGEGLKSEVLPHKERNNNVYIPRWVYGAVKSSRDDLRSKRLFPLTNKQRMKLYKLNANKSSGRRNLRKNLQDYGVPFELQIEGLGQVNP